MCANGLQGNCTASEVHSAKKRTYDATVLYYMKLHEELQLYPLKSGIR